MIILDGRSSVPLYEQIINGIKENIVKGILMPGDKIPSVRELATMVTTNPNTVAKAYTELERQRVTETIRGKGTFICSDYKAEIQEDRMEKVRENIKGIVLECKTMGVTREELIVIIDECLKNLGGEKDGNKEA